jgi:hypothetical protein
MTSTLKNLLTILALATIAFVAYYLYTQQSNNALSTGVDDAQLQDMLARTQIFIRHSEELDRIGSINTSLFTDPRFSTLRSFSKPVQESPVGRNDPFAEIGQSNAINSNQ